MLVNASLKCKTGDTRYLREEQITDAYDTRTNVRLHARGNEINSISSVNRNLLLISIDLD